MEFWERLFSSESESDSLPLFIEGIAPVDFSKLRRGIIITDTMDLYTSGAQVVRNDMLLFLQGSGFPANNYLPLVCWNDTIFDSIPLYMIGSGLTDNAIPVDGYIDLFINCPFGAELPLYLYGGDQPSVSDELPMYMHGSITTTDSLPLAIPEVFDLANDTLTLYTHGF